MIEIKTQTKRKTDWTPNVINANLVFNDFEFALVTSEYWGNYGYREIPLVQMTIDGNDYELDLDKFKEFVKNNLGRNKDGIEF